MAITKTLIRPRIMLYGFMVDSVAYRLCEKWCIEEFGERRRNDRGRWTCRYNKFYKRIDASIYFKNEEDAMAFKLRWR